MAYRTQSGTTKRLADSGCLFRNGDLAFAYCRKAGDGVQVVGADFDYQMLQISEQKKQRKSLYKNVRFVEADAQYLPFEDDTFQIVSVAFGLRNIADTDRGLQEMTRVCKPVVVSQSWSFQSRGGNHLRLFMDSI